ncbi:hypothetical protein LJ739_06970 [Aestuariibacter halophilus]|uniref:Uncharacterized protein n=1 Tax=Fluctibacter halophilus TaxID=226011 RepID=A0ABS8G662_9ALTE|nr:hypothetical protein [Aestuariibacter halophilus]MCC2615979.1 hypothetical protein [Aestuariibacter halophilus]
MKLEGKCCKPANETEYELMKAVAVAAGYNKWPYGQGFSNNWPCCVTSSGLFCNGCEPIEITLHDWVFKSTHKDTGELVVPEWADHVFLCLGSFGCGDSNKMAPVKSIGYVPEPLKVNKLVTIITRQPETEQSWHERGEFPPPQTYCQVRLTGIWMNCFAVGPDDLGGFVYRIDGGYDVMNRQECFRPIPEKSPRDKGIEELSKIFYEAGGEPNDKSFGAIYDAMKSGKLDPPTAHNVPE